MKDGLQTKGGQIELSSDVEKDVGFTLSHGIFFTQSNVTVIEMVPSSFVRGVCRVMAWSCPWTMVYNNGREIIQSPSTGVAPRFVHVWENIFTHVQALDRELHCSVYFGSVVIIPTEPFDVKTKHIR